MLGCKAADASGAVGIQVLLTRKRNWYFLRALPPVFLPGDCVRHARDVTRSEMQSYQRVRDTPLHNQHSNSQVCMVRVMSVRVLDPQVCMMRVTSVCALDPHLGQALQGQRPVPMQKSAWGEEATWPQHTVCSKPQTKWVVGAGKAEVR